MRFYIALSVLLLSVLPSVGQEPPVYRLPPDELVPQVVSLETPSGMDWGVTLLKCPDVWKSNKGKGVKVAILDTGVKANHPDFVGRIAGTKDFTGSRTGPDDVQGHGTHCVGRVSGGNHWPGVAPEATIFSYKVLDDRGSGSVVGIAKGIDQCVTDDVDVASLSLGGPSPDSFIPPALARAEAAGVIVIAAAGNEGPNDGTVGYPGGYGKVIAVAAVDDNKQVAVFSSRGTAVFVAAPGVGIKSQYKNGGYATMSGTSMACPHVAGIAALWVAANQQVAKKDRPGKFREWLQSACEDLPPVGRDKASGYGWPAITSLSVGNPPPPPPEGSVTLTLADLTTSARAKLAAIGVTQWSVEVKGSKAQPPPVSDDDTYNACIAAIRAGKRVTLAVGPTDVQVDYKVSSGYKSITDGIYDCWLEGNTPTFQRRAPVPIPQSIQVAPVGFPFIRSGCPGGVCPVR